MDVEVIEKDLLLDGLLQFNYFPAQKKDKEEIPPIINSLTFSAETANKLRNLPLRSDGYDQVEYRSTKFNNISRVLSIPHPVPYSKLCYAIYDNWDRFNYITTSSTSLVTPNIHNDGRIIVMDYEYPKDKFKRQMKLGFGKKFYVETDIANFYPSIYSHSIPWALVGFDYSKTHKDQTLWFNQIDKFQRYLKRNETNGVPIGPATSNILSEIILGIVDNKLQIDGFTFIRYIDDYEAYCDTYEECERFVRRLSEELSKFKLLLNAKKTQILHAPFPTTVEWITDLSTRLTTKDNHITTLVRFLDYSTFKQGENPDGSILKYAAKTVVNNVNNADSEIVLNYLLGLCIQYPILIPLLMKLFKTNEPYLDFGYTTQLIKILNEQAINRRSDAVAWILYYLNKYDQDIPALSAGLILDSKDCISILMLYLSSQFDKKVIEFCDGLNKDDIFLLDQYWLLLYQLFFDGKIQNPYKDTSKVEFDTLKTDNVTFVIDPEEFLPF